MVEPVFKKKIDSILDAMEHATNNFNMLDMVHEIDAVMTPTGGVRRESVQEPAPRDEHSIIRQEPEFIPGLDIAQEGVPRGRGASISGFRGGFGNSYDSRRLGERSRGGYYQRRGLDDYARNEGSDSDAGPSGYQRGGHGRFSRGGRGYDSRESDSFNSSGERGNYAVGDVRRGGGGFDRGRSSDQRGSSSERGGSSERGSSERGFSRGFSGAILPPPRRGGYDRGGRWEPRGGSSDRGASGYQGFHRGGRDQGRGVGGDRGSRGASGDRRGRTGARRNTNNSWWPRRRRMTPEEDLENARRVAARDAIEEAKIYLAAGFQPPKPKTPP